MALKPLDLGDPVWPETGSTLRLSSASPHKIHVYVHTSGGRRPTVAHHVFLDETLGALSTQGDLRKTINTHFYFETRAHGFLAISGGRRVKAARRSLLYASGGYARPQDKRANTELGLENEGRLR